MRYDHLAGSPRLDAVNPSVPPFSAPSIHLLRFDLPNPPSRPMFLPTPGWFPAAPVLLVVQRGLAGVFPVYWR